MAVWMTLDFLLLAILSVGLNAFQEEKKGPELKFNSEVQWKRFEFAIEDAAKFQKPAMLFFLKSWCKACHNLMDGLESSEEFIKLSENFVMGKAVDEDVPFGNRYNLDGKYAPKIIFQDPKGNILKKLVNPITNGDKEKYFYGAKEEVIAVMENAIEKASLDSGFGKEFQWHEYQDGLLQAKLQHKPMMLVFHQDWCGACQRLKPKFAGSKDILEMSRHFIMVNEEDENVIKSEKFAFEDEYYPKITFLDAEGQVMKDEYNIGTPHEHVKFYYGDPSKIVASMKRVTAKTLSKLDRGYGKSINWTTFEDGLVLAKELKRPIFLLIHKSYCGACKSLKPRIRNSKEIAELSKKFIMVNCEDDEEPMDDQYDIDGSYVPRLLFLDSNGMVEPSIRNDDEGYQKAHYAYAGEDEIVRGMKMALEMNLGLKEAREEVPVSEFVKQVEWMNLTSGQIEAHKSHKPLMLVISKSWCTFSQALKKELQASVAFIDLTHRFVMVHAEDDDEPKDKKYDVDGTYSPRIFFQDPYGTVHNDLNNTESELDGARFYYKDAEEVVEGMNAALNKIKTSLDRGFGEFIEWQTMEKGLEIAKEKKKPMLLIIHRTWCSACKAFKPIMQSSKITSLTRDFVMVNLEDDEEPEDNQFNVDGGYYPRVFFLDPEGKVQRDLHNDDPNYIKFKFSYGYEESLARVMNRAVEKFKAVEEAKPKQELPKRTRRAEANWMKVKPGLAEAKEMNMPAMVMIHRASCQACKAVARMMKRDENFVGKSKDFVMIDIEDEVDPEADSYDVDGKYVPRIYFLRPDGSIMKEIWNVGTQYLDNKFYYYEMTAIYRSMEKALNSYLLEEKPMKDEL